MGDRAVREVGALRRRPGGNVSLPAAGRTSTVKLTAVLADLGLEPKAAKTRIVHLENGGEGFDFLGFHHRLVRARGCTGARRFVFLARYL
jgi:hypothetical protein